MQKNLIIIGVLVVVLIGGGFLFFNSKKSGLTTTTQTLTQTDTVSTQTASDAAMNHQEVMVTITAEGFSPKEVKIKVGDSVSWINQDAKNHEVSSDPHPTHSLYPPINTIGLLKQNEKRSLMFPEKGTFTYHDHLNSSLKGTIIVE